MNERELRDCNESLLKENENLRQRVKELEKEVRVNMEQANENHIAYVYERDQGEARLGKIESQAQQIYLTVR
jgi:site-specific DNA-adenine methylase